MKKIFVFLLLLALCACAPRPPCCDNSLSGMRPINPDRITEEEVATWRAQADEEAERLRQENAYVLEN